MPTDTKDAAEPKRGAFEPTDKQGFLLKYFESNPKAVDDFKSIYKKPSEDPDKIVEAVIQSAAETWKYMPHDFQYAVEATTTIFRVLSDEIIPRIPKGEEKLYMKTCERFLRCPQASYPDPRTHGDLPISTRLKTALKAQEFSISEDGIVTKKNL